MFWWLLRPFLSKPLHSDRISVHGSKKKNRWGPPVQFCQMAPTKKVRRWHQSPLVWMKWRISSCNLPLLSTTKLLPDLGSVGMAEMSCVFFCFTVIFPALYIWHVLFCFFGAYMGGPSLTLCALHVAARLPGVPNVRYQQEFSPPCVKLRTAGGTVLVHGWPIVLLGPLQLNIKLYTFCT